MLFRSVSQSRYAPVDFRDLAEYQDIVVSVAGLDLAEDRDIVVQV